MLFLFVCFVLFVFLGFFALTMEPLTRTGNYEGEKNKQTLKHFYIFFMTPTFNTSVMVILFTSM